MPNLIIKLRRWSREEIEAVTGQSLGKNKNKIDKETKTGRVLRDAKQNENEKETENRRVLRSAKQNENEKDTKNRRVLRISKQKEDQNDTAITIANKTKKAINKNTTTTNTNTSKNENKKNEKETTKKNHSKAQKRRIELSDTDKVNDPEPASKKQKLSKDQETVSSDRITRSKTKTQEASKSQKSEMKRETSSNSDKSKCSKTNGHSENGSGMNKSKPKTEQIVKKCRSSKATSPNKADFENEMDPKVENMNENIGQTFNEIAVMDFRIGEVVWAKIRGHPGWPARIESIYGEKRQTFRVYWFNDYRTSNIYRSQIYKFHSNFEKFAKPFDSQIGLETAAREALLYLANGGK